MLACELVLCSCDGENDDTAAVQSAVDRGGVVSFAARTYHLSRTIVIRNSNTTIQGAGPLTVFQYQASAFKTQCVNDRVFTTPCDIGRSLPRRIAGAIAIGDVSFSAVDELSDLQPADWLIVTDIDSVVGDIVNADWVQVDSVAGLVVHVRSPFRTAFPNAREWVPGHSGLGFRRVVSLVENIQFRNFNIAVPDAGTQAAAVGISVYAALQTTIDQVVVNSFNAQPLYSRLSKNLTITGSEGHGNSVLNEFASTVDLTLRGDTFGEEDAAGLGLDLGTAFFDVSGNNINMSRNIGVYLLYGVHDGTFIDNQIGPVGSATNANGILAWGTQNVSISDNYLAGGAGPQSTGISVRSYTGEIVIPSVNVTLSGNTFGPGWVFDYERGTIPGG